MSSVDEYIFILYKCIKAACQLVCITIEWKRNMKEITKNVRTFKEQNIKCYTCHNFFIINKIQSNG